MVGGRAGRIVLRSRHVGVCLSTPGGRGGGARGTPREGSMSMQVERCNNFKITILDVMNILNV